MSLNDHYATGFKIHAFRVGALHENFYYCFLATQHGFLAKLVVGSHIIYCQLIVVQKMRWGR